MKIEVRNEVWPPPPPGCLSQRLKIETRPCCGDMYCCPIYPPGGRYSGKTLILEIPGGDNAFVCVDNGLPAALPHASPRLKIPMAPHWCCRVTPRARYPGGSVSWENTCSREIGGKSAGGSWWSPKWRLRFETKFAPPRAAYPRGLRLGRDPFTARGVGIPGKLLFSRSRGVNAFVCMDNGLPAALPHASPRLKIPMAPHWCCRVTPPGRVPGVSVSWENSCSREIGGKSEGGSWWSPKWRLRFETKFGPPGCLSQRLKIATRPCCGDRYCGPIYPPGGRYSGKTLILEIPGVNAFVYVDNGLPAALPHASPRIKFPMAPHWCCRVTPRAGYPGGRYPGKTLVLEKLEVKSAGGSWWSEMKIEVRNEVCPPRAAYPRGLKLGRYPVVVKGIAAPFTPRRVGIPGKLLFARSRGVNAFVCVENGLPAAPPHASPRLKIPMAPHWCCRVTPPGRVPGGSVSWEKSCSREIGGKSAEGYWWSPKWRLRFETKFAPPPGCLSQRLKIGTRPCCGDRYCCPIYPRGVGIPRKLLFSRSRGVNAFVCVDNGLPAALPHASRRLKIPMAPHWFCRVTPRAGYPGSRYPGKTLVLEKLRVKVQGGSW